jgi:hypothetical protein
MMGLPSDRPTIPPSFDFEEFARDSDSRVAAAAALPEPEPPEEPESQVRLATRPAFGAAVTDEAWARSARGALVVTMSPDVLCKLPLDHRAGFLLSQMDGATDLETLLSIGHMPRAEALRILRDLFECGVIDFKM